MSMPIRLPLLTFALVAGVALPAGAQSGHLLAAGVGVSGVRANGGPWDRSFDYFIFRLPRPERLGISWNIGSDSSDVPPAATPSRIAGTLESRHFLFGPGYTWRRQPVELTTSVLLGPSTNTFTRSADAPGDATLRSHISMSAMADVTLWIDLGSRFGLKVSGDYMVWRPPLLFSVDDTETSWKARRLHTQVGLVVGFY